MANIYYKIDGNYCYYTNTQKEGYTQWVQKTLPTDNVSYGKYVVCEDNPLVLPEYPYRLFTGMTNLVFPWTLDFSGAMTAVGLFGYSKLTTIDLSDYNLYDVSNVSNMFYHCDDLTSIAFWDDWSKITEAGSICAYCESLQSVTLNIDNAPKLRGIDLMFYHCSNLRTANVTIANTNVLVTAGSVFEHCTNMETCTFRVTPQRKLMGMSNLFGSCRSLREIDMSWYTDFSPLLESGLDELFRDCVSLRRIVYNEDIPDWEREVYYLGKSVGGASMFQNCISLPNYDDSSNRSWSIYRANNKADFGYFGIETTKLYYKSNNTWYKHYVFLKEEGSWVQYDAQMLGSEGD